MKLNVLLICILFFVASCTTNEKAPEKTLPEAVTSVLNYSVEAQMPHDTLSFTEGLLFYQSQLFESTGSPDNIPYAKSVLGIVNTETGKINVKVELDRRQFFGEGIVIVNDKIFQLTYKNQLCFVYDLKTFKKIKEYSYENKEGWGMTSNGSEIIMSDGTHILSVRDPENFNLLRTIAVSENGYSVDYLNELEYIKGYIYSNIWGSNTIVKIDPATGNVVGKLDLTRLFEDERMKHPRLLELNGIAYDSTNDKVWVTGKMWSSLYQLKFDIN